MTTDTRNAITAISKMDPSITPAMLKQALAVLAGQMPTEPAAAPVVENAFITYPQAAEMLGVKVWTARRIAKDGEITVVDVRGKNHVVRQSVVDYINRKTAA